MAVIGRAFILADLENGDGVATGSCCGEKGGKLEDSPRNSFPAADVLLLLVLLLLLLTVGRRPSFRFPEPGRLRVVALIGRGEACVDGCPLRFGLPGLLLRFGLPGLLLALLPGRLLELLLILLVVTVVSLLFPVPALTGLLLPVDWLSVAALLLGLIGRLEEDLAAAMRVSLLLRFCSHIALNDPVRCKLPPAPSPSSLFSSSPTRDS
mmetsp:Transcript_4019/g.6366  ORF Transcript_4019/g.6366 Transcript_4019/m.6366 type:complete len:209 (-) Transcript_4019:2534-3160(-)